MFPPKSPSKAGSARRRIVIALDQDNFYCGVERVLNPSLRHLPVGITQKSLLATISYEARALGVQKLCSIRKAQEICPEMVFVDGEDLTNYRAFSRRVGRLINLIVGARGGEMGGGVEKLGMDEVFVDVTDLVYDHLEKIISAVPSSQDSESALCFFELPPSAKILRNIPQPSTFPPIPNPYDAHPTPGFSYDPSHLPGHILSPSILTSSFPSTNIHIQALLVASHLTSFIRSEIKRLMGLTSSGGVARNKLLAKLVASVKKPDEQTTLIAEAEDVDEGEGEEDSKECVLTMKEKNSLVQKFLDVMELRKLNGFGSKIITQLEEHLDSRSTSYSSPLTVHTARTLFTHPTFLALFQNRLGDRLWSLLHGDDIEAVKANPEYPKQISVEDSYAVRMRRPFWCVKREMEGLMMDLVRRLEEELMEGPEDISVQGIINRFEAGRDGRPPPLPDTIMGAEGKKKTWKRFPTQFRLQLRLHWDYADGRQSKSVPFPAFLFESSKGVEERVVAFMGKIGVPLLKEILGFSPGREVVEDKVEFDIYVINVAVTNLSTTPPPPSLLDTWSANPNPKERALQNVDPEFIMSLPKNLRAEILASKGLKLSEVKQLLHNKEGKREHESETETEGHAKKKRKTGFTATQAIEVDLEDSPSSVAVASTPKRQMSPIDLRTQVATKVAGHIPVAGGEASSPDSSVDDDEEDRDDSLFFDEIDGPVDLLLEDTPAAICQRCGFKVLSFAVSAHARWHEPSVA